MASTYLTRSLASTNTSWTFSAWVKRERFDLTNYLISWGNSGTDGTGILFAASGELAYYSESSPDNKYKITSAKYRDVNGWYHVVCKCDSNAITLYVNGEEPTQSWSVGSSANPLDTSTMAIGKWVTSNYYHHGLMSHVHFIDGTAYNPSTFGETDSTTGQWKIKTSPSVTYGTNGFFLFKDDNSVNDQSGNGNNFTLASGTLTQTEDNPSNVFATWNPLIPLGTFSNGNTVWTSASSGDGSAFSTLGVEAGKYYMECKITNANASGWELGVAPVTRLDGNANGVGTSTVGGVGYTGDGYIRRAGTTVSSGLTTFAQNDIISCALDMDNRKVYFYKNGAILNSGTGVDLPSTTGHYVFATGDWYSAASTSASANFGNGYFGTTAITSEGTNASGIGKFEYDVPTGYTALSTKGLNE